MLVPQELRYVGLKLSFVNADGQMETWEYQGGAFANVGSWKQQSSGGNKILEWNTDAATTRKQVAANERKPGMQISYRNAEGEWVNEQYVGTLITDAEWEKNSNWEKNPNQTIISDIDKNAGVFYKFDYTAFNYDKSADKVTDVSRFNDLLDSTKLYFSIANTAYDSAIILAFFDESHNNLPEYNVVRSTTIKDSNGCYTGSVKRPTGAKYFTVWAYRDTDYRDYEYIALLKEELGYELYNNVVYLKANSATKETTRNLYNQVGIASGSIQIISNPEELYAVWKRGLAINADGQEIPNVQYFTTDFIDVSNIERIGFCTLNFQGIINIASYSDEFNFIPENAIGNIVEYEKKVICGVWEKGENTRYIKMCVTPFREAMSYPGVSIYKYERPCYVGYNFDLKSGSCTINGYKHKGYVIPYYKEGVYINFSIGDAYKMKYFTVDVFSKEFKHMNKAHTSFYDDHFFNAEQIANMISDDYEEDEIGYLLVKGAFDNISLHTTEIDIRKQRNIYSQVGKSLKSIYADKLIEAENIQAENLEEFIGHDYSDAVIVKVRNQSDLDNLIYQHNEDGTKSGNIKGLLYKAVEKNYETTKNYIVEFYDNTYLLADANYPHGIYFVNNIFVDYPNINLLFRNAIGNKSVVLTSDGVQYSFNDGIVSVNKRHKDTGLRESFTLNSKPFSTHYAVEYKGEINEFHYSKFIDGDFEDIEISSLDGITPDNCIYDKDYTSADNIYKFKMPLDLHWITLSEEQCEFVYCYFRCSDGYTSARGRVVKIENGYAYISPYSNSLAPYRRVRIYNLPILQEKRITIKRDSGGVVRIYIPNNVKKLYECTIWSGMLFYGRNSYIPKSVTIQGLNMCGSGKIDRVNSAVTYHGQGLIGAGGCNIKISNCKFRNIGTKCIYIRDTEVAMKTDYCVISDNSFYNTEQICAFVGGIKGKSSIHRNTFKYCGMNMISVDSAIIANSAEQGAFIFQNKIYESSVSASITCFSLAIAIVENNYIRNSAEFIANNRRCIMMSDTGCIYSGNASNTIIRHNYIDGFFGDWTCRIIYCDDGSWNKTIYGNIVLTADIEYDGNTCGAIYINPQSGESLKNSNNIVINNIISRRYYIDDNKDPLRPCYAGKNLIIGIGAGQIINNAAQKAEADVFDKQAIVVDGEIYTELDLTGMFIRGEAAKHIHIWKNIRR